MKTANPSLPLWASIRRSNWVITIITEHGDNKHCYVKAYTGKKAVIKAIKQCFDKIRIKRITNYIEPFSILNKNDSINIVNEGVLILIN